jgi:type II secretory pathway component PulJ
MKFMKNSLGGFSIIELLVGIAIGLIIVATATIMYAGILKSQKEITASARLNQEIGAAMAVMSNEIRRAGFRMCDSLSYDCKVSLVDELEIPFMLVKYAYGEVIKISDGGQCIEYRYNANNYDNTDVVGEHLGFRLKNGVIEMAEATGDVVCGNDNNWVSLTDPGVMHVSALSFTTTGSKCLNMEEARNWYWVAGDDETKLACDLTPPVSCTPLGVTPCGATLVENGDNIFGTHQIVIELNANLSRDPTVAKHMETSVKVENPWIGKAP